MYVDSKLMNIQKICVAQFNIMPLTSRANSQNQQFGIRMAKPASCDSVSFQGKAPNMSVKDMAALARKEARALRDASQRAEAKKAAKNAAKEEAKKRTNSFWDRLFNR